MTFSIATMLKTSLWLYSILMRRRKKTASVQMIMQLSKLSVGWFPKLIQYLDIMKSKMRF